MGGGPSQFYVDGRKPYELPDSFSSPTFPPEYGFKGPRQKRVSKLSEEEMRALQIPRHQRDYCAHIWKDYLLCRREYRPLYGLCSPERHAYHHCQIQDYQLSMMEYEREKRLRERAARKAAAAS